MKKIFAISTCVLLLLLSGCSKFLVPQEVTVGDVVYRTGFYGDLWPINLEFDGDSFELDGITFNYVNDDRYDWIHTNSVGQSSNGILYCAEGQWKQAETYYADPQNFEYYCTRNDFENISIADFDYEMFKALTKFADENSYDPFNQAKNNQVETLHLPIPDNDISPELTFYRESIDGCFTSYKGNTYHILDGKLYLLFYYDFGHGKYEEMLCVAVPDEISQYIVGLAEHYGF